MFQLRMGLLSIQILKLREANEQSEYSNLGEYVTQSLLYRLVQLIIHLSFCSLAAAPDLLSAVSRCIENDQIDVRNVLVPKISVSILVLR